jgi:hypothetical protein
LRKKGLSTVKPLTVRIYRGDKNSSDRRGIPKDETRAMSFNLPRNCPCRERHCVRTFCSPQKAASYSYVPMLCTQTCATSRHWCPGAITPEIIFKTMSGLQNAGRLVDERWEAGGKER